MNQKTIVHKLQDFLEWEFSVEISDKLEAKLDSLASLIIAEKTNQDHLDEDLEDEDDFGWPTISNQEDPLFDSLDEEYFEEDEEDE